ncbi:hypothetical protein K1719_040401 [Acacia pycnantha]|nr:hypothetical protein K1719_040401 [Acacia pycnantha]
MKRSRKSNRVSWAPGFNLCQCYMMVHVGGKRTHGRYLLLGRELRNILGFTCKQLCFYYIFKSSLFYHIQNHV